MKWSTMWKARSWGYLGHVLRRPPAWTSRLTHDPRVVSLILLCAGSRRKQLLLFGSRGWTMSNCRVSREEHHSCATRPCCRALYSSAEANELWSLGADTRRAPTTLRNHFRAVLPLSSLNAPCSTSGSCHICTTRGCANTLAATLLEATPRHSSRTPGCCRNSGYHQRRGAVYTRSWARHQTKLGVQHQTRHNEADRIIRESTKPRRQLTATVRVQNVFTPRSWRTGAAKVSRMSVKGGQLPIDMCRASQYSRCGSDLPNANA